MRFNSRDEAEINNVVMNRSHFDWDAIRHNSCAMDVYDNGESLSPEGMLHFLNAEGRAHYEANVAVVNGVAEIRIAAALAEITDIAAEYGVAHLVSFVRATGDTALDIVLHADVVAYAKYLPFSNPLCTFALDSSRRITNRRGLDAFATTLEAYEVHRYIISACDLAAEAMCEGYAPAAE